MRKKFMKVSQASPGQGRRKTPSFIPYLTAIIGIRQSTTEAVTIMMIVEMIGRIEKRLS